MFYNNKPYLLAYGLIGGLGTAFGPLIGVIIDIGILESIRVFSGYRMVIFGLLVAVLLIIKRRGLLDEAFVRRIKSFRGLLKENVYRKKNAKD